MEAEEKARFAWEPVTPAGAAAFADASLRRVWLVQLLVALLSAATILWFLHTDWFPVVGQAIRKMPARGSIAAGQLRWDEESPVGLGENRFLAVSVDLRHEGNVRSPAHIQAEFGKNDIVFISLFGALQTRYPRGYTIAFNRDELEPWWGAWSPAILAITAAGVVSSLMLCWALLALLYSPVAWLVAFFANRQLTWSGAYRACGAALMPGALFMALTVVLYGLGALDVILLLIMVAAHFIIGWVYVFLVPFWRPRITQATPSSANPFTPEKKPQ